MRPQRGGCSAQLHVLPALSVFREEAPGPRPSRMGENQASIPSDEYAKGCPVGAEQAAHTGLLCCSQQP